MNRIRILSTASLAALALALTSCSQEPARRVNGPPSSIRTQEVKDARWISGEELIQATERAARSPLVSRAVTDLASDPRLSLLPSGAVGAIGTTPDGSTVRFTVLPYQYSDDVDHAMYFALLESKYGTKVESFEALQNRKPDVNSGFEPVNGAEHRIWLRQGPVYVLSQNGVVRRAPERFNMTRFGVCFFTMADNLLAQVGSSCGQMGNFPGCVTIGSTIAITFAAILCAVWSYSS